MQDLAAEIERLKVDLMSTREKNGVYLSNERYEQVRVDSRNPAADKGSEKGLLQS